MTTNMTNRATSRSHNGKRVQAGTDLPSGKRNRNASSAILLSNWASLASGSTAGNNSTTAVRLGGLATLNSANRSETSQTNGSLGRRALNTAAANKHTKLNTTCSAVR
jgi:hypothetical protein